MNLQSIIDHAKAHPLPLLAGVGLVGVVGWLALRGGPGSASAAAGADPAATGGSGATPTTQPNATDPYTAAQQNLSLQEQLLSFTAQTQLDSAKAGEALREQGATFDTGNVLTNLLNGVTALRGTNQANIDFAAGSDAEKLYASQAQSAASLGNMDKLYNWFFGTGAPAGSIGSVDALDVEGFNVTTGVPNIQSGISEGPNRTQRIPGIDGVTTNNTSMADALTSNIFAGTHFATLFAAQEAPINAQAARDYTAQSVAVGNASALLANQTVNQIQLGNAQTQNAIDLFKNTQPGKQSTCKPFLGFGCGVSGFTDTINNIAGSAASYFTGGAVNPNVFNTGTNNGNGSPLSSYGIDWTKIFPKSPTVPVANSSVNITVPRDPGIYVPTMGGNGTVYA